MNEFQTNGRSEQNTCQAGIDDAASSKTEQIKALATAMNIRNANSIVPSANRLDESLDAESVTIKIPDPADFNAAVESQSDFLIAISQNVVNPKIGGKVILTGWEANPFRLTLDLGSSLAVGLVGEMARVATTALKKQQEGRQFEHMVKGLDVKSDAIHEVLRGVRVYVDLLLDVEAKKLHAKNFSESSDPDQEARLSHGIKLLMGLIEKGGRIDPLGAPSTGNGANGNGPVEIAEPALFP